MNIPHFRVIMNPLHPTAHLQWLFKTKVLASASSVSLQNESTKVRVFLFILRVRRPPTSRKEPPSECANKSASRRRCKDFPCNGTECFYTSLCQNFASRMKWSISRQFLLPAKSPCSRGRFPLWKKRMLLLAMRRFEQIVFGIGITWYVSPSVAQWKE